MAEIANPEYRFFTADWMPKDSVLVLGACPDHRQFTSLKEFVDEWARRSVVFTNIGEPKE
jgi:hypothetical protein